jgi:isoleucyl-tRNA synthetase
LAELSFYNSTQSEHGTHPQSLRSQSVSRRRGGEPEGNKSATPTIDKLVNSPQLTTVAELLRTTGGIVNGLAYTIQKIYSRVRVSAIGVLLILAVVITLYIGIALMVVIDRLPLLETILQGIGIVMTGVFCYRNLWTSSNRQATFDRIIAYRQAIFGTSPTVRKISAVEHSGDLTMIQTTSLPASSPATPPLPTRKSNGVDELRYLFLASQVELIDDASKLQGLQHQATSAGGKIGVTTAEGEKCDRCWNYSPTVGQDAAQPLICDRCVDALTGDF